MKNPLKVTASEFLNVLLYGIYGCEIHLMDILLVLVPKINSERRWKRERL